MNHNYNDRYRNNYLWPFMAGAALASAVIGYVLYGPGGRIRRDDIEEYVDDVTATLRSQLADLGEYSRETYERVADEVVEDYGIAKDLTKAQLRRLAHRMKAEYRHIRARAEDSIEAARREVDDETRRNS